MKIRTRLFTLVGILAGPLIINLFILVLLAYFTQRSTQEINVASGQQAATLRMQAQLRDAEAALYRYQIEGEAGFSQQFLDQLDNFQEEITIFDNQSTTRKVQIWVEELISAHNQAKTQGMDLIASRDTQSENLAVMIAVQNQIETGILEIQSNYGEAPAYQDITNHLIFDIREMSLSATTYIVNARETERSRFTNAAISFGLHLDELESLMGEDQSLLMELREQFNQAQEIGTRLINEKDQQQTIFAQFAANIFHLGQQTIVDEIQPYSAEYLHTTQTRLINTLTLAVIASIVLSVISMMLALGYATSEVQRITNSIRLLLDGADRVALGNYQETVQIHRQDELQYLSHAFNNMMKQLNERQGRLNDLLEQLAIVQEEERRLVGLDLHDGLTQTLLSANMHLSTLAALATDLDAQAVTELNLCQTRLQESIAEVRWVISELRPIELEDFGLVAGLRQYTAKVAQHVGWTVSFVAEPLTQALKPAMEHAVFRIVQEALSNTRKYADTNKVQVKLEMTERNLVAEVQDWGNGFDLSKLEGRDTLGLLGMRERAELFGGNLTISTEPRRGTIIRAAFPLN